MMIDKNTNQVFFVKLQVFVVKIRFLLFNNENLIKVFVCTRSHKTAKTWLASHKLVHHDYIT